MDREGQGARDREGEKGGEGQGRRDRERGTGRASIYQLPWCPL